MTHTAPILVAEIDEVMLDSDYAQLEPLLLNKHLRGWTLQPLEESGPPLGRGSTTTKSDPGVCYQEILAALLSSPVTHCMQAHY